MIQLNWENYFQVTMFCLYFLVNSNAYVKLFIAYKYPYFSFKSGIVCLITK